MTEVLYELRFGKREKKRVAVGWHKINLFSDINWRRKKRAELIWVCLTEYISKYRSWVAEQQIDFCYKYVHSST